MGLFGGDDDGGFMGTGVGGSVGGIVGRAVDPFDILGTKDAKRRKEAEDQIAGDKDELAKMMAKRPEYGSILDENGKLKSVYSVDADKYKLAGPKQIAGDVDARLAGVSGVNVGDISRGKEIKGGANFNQANADLAALHDRAFSTGTSPYAQKLLDRQALDEATARDALSRDSATNTQAAMADLAATGGIDSAARERMMKTSGKDLMLRENELARTGRGERLGVLANDEANKMSLQTALPGMSLQTDAYDTGLQAGNRDADFRVDSTNMGKNLTQGQFNSNLGMQKANMYASALDSDRSAQAAIADKTGRNQSDLDKYNTEMSAFGAGKTADAQVRSGNKGGLLSNIFG
jgi:hypothetical protein